MSEQKAPHRADHVRNGAWSTLVHHAAIQEKNPNYMQYVLADLSKLGEVLNIPEFSATMDDHRHDMEQRFKLETLDPVTNAN